MAKLTLLDMVQDIANDLDTEQINSIDDTVESVQIAQIVKTCYFELMASRNWPHLQRTVQLDGLSDTATPTHLKLPELTKEVVTFSYNCRTEDNPTRDTFREIKYVEPDHFLRKCNSRDVTQDNVIKVTDIGGAPVYVFNDKSPTFYTSFDDECIVLDAYNADLESTLTTSNTQAIVFYEPSWTHADTHIPDIPSEAFPLLLSESKSTAFLVLKQQTNAKAEQKAIRQNTWLARKSWRVEGGVRYPNYGRKKTSAYNRPVFDKG